MPILDKYIGNLTGRLLSRIPSSLRYWGSGYSSVFLHPTRNSNDAVDCQTRINEKGEKSHNIFMNWSFNFTLKHSWSHLSLIFCYLIIMNGKFHIKNKAKLPRENSFYKVKVKNARIQSNLFLLWNQNCNGKLKTSDLID